MLAGSAVRLASRPMAMGVLPSYFFDTGYTHGRSIAKTRRPAAA